jgi:VWFA-related protein
LRLVHDYTFNGAELMACVDRLPARLPFKLSARSHDADRANISLGALEQTALANERSGKRTAIVWLSPGYPVVDKSDITDPKMWDRFQQAVKNLSKELLDARVTIYSIDPRGVMPFADESLGSTSPFGFGDMALGQLARETGGHAYYGRNDVDTQVANSLAQSATFYTLLYYPSNGDYNGKFRKIHMKLKAPKLGVQTRTGYYAFPDNGPRTIDEVTLGLKRHVYAVGLPSDSLLRDGISK